MEVALTGVGRSIVAAVLLVACLVPGLAQEVSDATLDQREQLEAWRRQLQRPAELPAGLKPAVWLEPVAEDLPCRPVLVVRITLAEGESAADTGALPLGEAKDIGAYEGACLGARNVERLRVNLQARLAAQGFVTSYLVVPAQDLSAGALEFRLQPGRIDRIEIEGPASGKDGGPSRNALSLYEGAVLNLREIEHSLENLNRLPSQTAQVLIEPGGVEHTSTIRILLGDRRSWSAAIGIDSTDTREYGRWQLSAHAALDAPLGISDQIHLSASMATEDQGEAGRPLQSSVLLHWSVPWRRHLFSLSASQARHQRSIAGGVGRFLESGTDSQVQLRSHWTAWRGQAGRAAAWAGLGSRRARTAIDDVELISRRRIATEASAGASVWRRLECGEASMEAEHGRLLHLQRDALFQETLVRSPRHWRLQLDLRCRAPVDAVILANWVASLSAWLQGVDRPLDGTDLVTVGRRYSVRGHDASQVLTGLGAAIVRAALQSPGWAAGEGLAWSASLGIDWGRIDRPVDSGRAARELHALVFALRGSAGHAGAELTLSWPTTPNLERRRAQWQGGLRWQF
jgi:hemolysin activation/secretion protein